MPKWDEITKNEKYQNLPPEARAQLKTEWFKANLLPEIESKPSLKEMGVEKVYEWFMQQPDDTGQGYVTSMLGAAGRGFGEMVPGAIEGVGALTGSEGLREFGQDVRGGLEDISPVNPIYGESIPVKLAGVGGQVGSMLATAGAGGLAGKALGGVGAATTGMRAAPLASAFLQGSAEGAREAEQYGMTGPEAYLRTLAGGAIEAGTEFLPFGMTAETALAKRILTGAPRTGTFLGAVGSEAGEEGLGQIASNIATKTLAPAGVETPDITAGALEAAAYGAAGGAMLGGVNALISTPPERQTQIQKDLQAEAGAIPKDTVPDQTNEEKMAAMEKGGVTVVSPDGKTAVIAPEPSMPDPAEVAKTIGDTSVEKLAATGNKASAAAQADFNAILAEKLGKAPEPTIQPEQEDEDAGVEVTPSPEMEQAAAPTVEKLPPLPPLNPEFANDSDQDLERYIKYIGLQAPPIFPPDATKEQKAEIIRVHSKPRNALLEKTLRAQWAERKARAQKVEAPTFKEEDQGAVSMPMMVTRDMKQQLVDLGYSKTDINSMRPEEATAIIKSGVSKKIISPAMEMPSPPQGVDMASAPVSPIITEAPLSEGAERVVTPEEESLAAKRRADLLSAAADVAKGKTKAQVSPAVTAMVTPQPVETQEDAIQEQIPDEGVLRQERPEMELQGVGEGNVQPEEVARKGEVQEEVITPPGEPTTATEGMVTPGGVATERDLSKPEQMNPDEFTPIGNPVNQGIFKSKKEASARLAELEDTISKSPQMMGILSEFNLTPSDAYEVAKDTRGRWSLGATHKHRVALAARERLPVSAAAVDTYGITLPEGYVKQGDLYIFQPEAPASPLRISIPEGATSSRTDNVKYQVAGLPDEVVDPFLAHGTDSADAVEALVKSGPRKDTEHYEGRLVPKDDGSPWGNTKTSASFVIISKPGQTTSSPNEIGAVVVNRTSRGDEKTASMIAGMERRLDGTGVAVLTPEELPNWLRRTVSQTTAAEKQTPVPLREGTGAAGVVQSEPVEGSIPTVEKVSPETESESTEKSPDTEPSEVTLSIAKRFGGRIAWSQGDLAIIEAFQLFGSKSLYIAVVGDRYSMTDFTLMKPEQRKSLLGENEELFLRKREEIVEANNRMLDKNPDGPFTNGQTVVVSKNVPQNVASVFREWVRLLGLGAPTRIVLTTPQDGIDMAAKYGGKFRRIGVTSLMSDNERGQMTPLGGDDFHIFYKKDASYARTLETLAHELGHILERQAFKNLPEDQRRAIITEHEKWLKRVGSQKALDGIRELRAMRVGRIQPNVDRADERFEELNAYWKSFSEWFADQVSRWATTTEKPLTVVEKFFARLGKKLREFFNLKGGQFAPNQKVAEWLDSLSPDFNSVVEATFAKAETESDSRGNLPAVEQIDRLVQSGAKPEEMDKFVKSLSDDQFNELVASEAFDVDPKLAIKPNDTYDAKRIKRRKFVDVVNASTKEVRKTAQQVFQEEEAAAKKQQAGEEMRSKAIDSIIGASEKKKRKFGQVTNSDAIAAVAMLVSSKDVPGVLTTWTGTKDEFLRDPANQTADPEIYARIKAGELVEGFFNKGRAYVFLDGIGVSDEDMLRGEQMSVTPQVAAVRRVLLHESLVHRGIHGLPLRHRRLILNWVRQNSTPAELDDLAKLYTEYANWRNSDYEFEALAEELLAKKVDSLTEIPKDGPMAKLMDILRQIWDFIVGYKREPTLSDLKSVVKLLKSGAEALANDRLKDGGEVKLSIRAYHGTPHKVDKFRSTRIGSGEGAQAYGWGLYFAEEKQVAEAYQQQLGGESGNLYTVELLPDADEFLDWDELVPKKVASKLSKLSIFKPFNKPGYVNSTLTAANIEAMTGKELYETIGFRMAAKFGAFNAHKSDVSRFLAERGIPGIKYLDAGSRGNSYGTRNYVIFDDNLVRILEENGQSLTPPEGSDIRFSRPQFSSETSTALSAGSEAARSSIYSERDMDIREAIRRAYEAMPKPNSVAVPIGELFAKTDELMPGVTQEEFSLVLQDLFEDNGAVLQEGEVVEPLTEQDRRYLALAEDEDANREELQRMVDEAAFKARKGRLRQTNYGYNLYLDGKKHSGPYESEDQAMYRAWFALGKPEAVARDDQGRIIPLSRRFDTGADIRGQINVTTPEGKRAGFVVVMPRAAKASRIKAEGPAVSKLQEDVRNIDEGSEKKDFKGVQFKDTKPNQRTVKPKQSYTDAAVEFVDSLQNEGNSLEDIAYSIQSPEFIEGLGIERDLSMQDAIGLEVRNRINNALRKAKAPSVKARLNKLNLSLSKFWQGIGSVKGQHLAIRQKLIADPRYRWMFIKDKAEEAMKEARENVATANITSTDDLTNQMNREGEKASEQAGQSVADETEAAIEDDQDAIDLATGEETLDERLKRLYEELKDWLRTKGAIVRARAARKSANAAKASFSKEQRDAIMQMSDEELDALEKKADENIERILNTILGKESDAKTPEQKKTRAKRKKMVDTAKKRAEAGKDIETPQEGEPESSEEQVSKAERTAQAILKDLSERYSDPLIIKEKKPNVDAMRELYKERVKQGVGPSQMTEKSFVSKAVELGSDEKTAGILWKAAELEIDAREAMRQDKILQRKAAVGARADAQAHRIIFAKERLKRQSGFSGIESNANKDTIIKAFQEQVKNPVSIEDFIARLRPLNVSETVAKRLFTAAEREKADLEAMKKFQAEKRALEEIEMAEKKASQIIYRFEEQYRQGFKNPPEGMTGQEQRDSIIRAFRDQVKNPTSFEEFAERLAKLKVGEEVAERMFLTASRERADLIRVKDIKIAKRKVEIASKQASRLIYETEKRLRQNSMDLETSKSGDSINKAFRDQISDPVSEKEFKQRLERLNVPSEVAGRLFKTAAREKADLEAMEAFRMLEGPDALKNILREIERMRRGEEIPLRTPIPWRQLLSQKAKTVEEYRQRIFDAISANEAFQNLSDDKKAKLADLFSEAWESKRKDILERMLTNLINKEEAAKRISQKGAQALREQSQRLVEDINLGILDSDELMKRLAEKFGIKSEFTEEEKQKIDSLIDTLQDSTLNRVKRNKAAYDLLKTLSGTVKVPITKLLADLWVTNVLSGINTMTSIALAVSSGAFELTSGVLRIIKAAIANQKQLPSEISASFKSLARFLGAFPREANLAWQYLVTGDRAFLDPSMNDVLNDLNYDSIGKSVSLAERLAESDKLLEKTVGVWMRTVSRLLTALDSFNSGVTKSGAIPIVARQLELDPATLAKVEESMNLQNYKDRIIQRDFAGVAPKTARERALVDSWAKDEMMADLDKYGEFTENADFFGQQGAMTLDPSGIGGMIYRLIKSVTGNLSAGSDRFLAESQRKWQERGKSDSMDATRLALAYALQFIAYNSANLAGLRFARFAGNKFNQGLSFIPGIGMLRLFEADLDKTHVKGKDAFMDMIQRNQFAGVMMSMVGLAILKAIADEPDDEKRGWAFNGGWANLTPERKQQKLAAGEKEYTIRVGDKVFNYQNWPISSVLAAIGGLSDLIRYSPEQWNEKSIAGRLGSAAASGVFAASEIPALSQFQELFGSNLSSKDPNEKKLDRFSRVMAGWGGGFVPRILKDFDFLAEPTIKKYDTLWERTASHIPVYRRYVGDDYYDILGKPIERKIYPGSREFMEKPSAPEYQILGKLNSRGIWLTPANAEHRMVGKGRNRRRLTQEEADAYSLETGKGYRQMLLRYGQRALQMPTERARAFLSDKADEVRDRALKKVYRR